MKLKYFMRNRRGERRVRRWRYKSVGSVGKKISTPQHLGIGVKEGVCVGQISGMGDQFYFKAFLERIMSVFEEGSLPCFVLNHTVTWRVCVWERALWRELQS